MGMSVDELVNDAQVTAYTTKFVIFFEIMHVSNVGQDFVTRLHTNELV